MKARHIIQIPFESSSSNSNSGSSSKKKTEAKATPDLLLSITSQAQHTSQTTFPDLTLVGTEGSVVVIGHVYSSWLWQILARDADISLQDFERVLRRILLQLPLSSTSEESQDGKDLGVSAVAAWMDPSAPASRQTGIRLRFRRTIGGIVRHVGEIELRCDENQEVDVVEWARVAVARSVQMEAENARLQARLVEVEDGLTQMRTQMEEFVRVKRQDEQVLMGSFVKVLNEKKAKIRELQSATGLHDRPWPEIPEDEEDEIKEEDAASSVGRRGGARARGRGASRGVASQRGKKRKLDDVMMESRLTLGDEQSEENDEMQQDDGAGTDQGSEQRLSDAAETDGDVDMSADSDDLDAPSHSQQADAKSGQTKPKAIRGGDATKDASSKVTSEKQMSKSRQHALRARKPLPASSENEDTTDDEL